MQVTGIPATFDYRMISPTARLVAFFRSFSNIPNSKAISDDMNGEHVAKEFCQDDFDVVTRFSAPNIEARYKCFDRFIESSRNVFEIAVGTSIERGHSITIGSKNTRYLGTDLPEVIADIRPLFAKYYPARPNHHLVSANVLSGEQMNAAIDLLGNGEVTVINEGLWLYLTPEERLEGATNIRRILERSGGTWITTDFDDLEYARSHSHTVPDGTRAALDRVKSRFENLIARPLESFIPRDRSELQRFFSNAGLQADAEPMVDDTMEISSIRTLWHDEPYPYQDHLRSLRLWKLTPL